MNALNDPTQFQTRRLPATPSSVNVENRTAELIISTGAGVERRDFEGAFVERLDIARSAVDTTRLIGAPLLDSHRQDSLERVLGAVDSVRFEPSQIIATVRFRSTALNILQDIADGFISNVSVGYSVQKWAENEADGKRIRTAVKWTPFEVSLVPVGADADAKVRSQKEADMPETPPEATPQNRGQVNAAIRSIAATANLDQTWIDTQVDANASEDQARAAAFEAMQERAGGNIDTISRAQIGQDNDDPNLRAQAMGEALFTRISPSHEPHERARQYVGFTIADMARETLRLRGESTMGLSPSTLITRSLHTTSDFSIILGDTVGRTLRGAYESAPSGIKQVARQTTAKDFRTKSRIMLGEAPTLEKVNEHGEFKSGTMAEAKESYKVDTFGRIIGITRQAMVNDDIGAFADLSRRLGIAAADFEIDQLVTLLESNPLMHDGKTLFLADHKNLADVTGMATAMFLAEARLALRKQTGVSGKPINVVPSHLLVPAESEYQAEKELSDIHATTVGDVNPFSKLSLVVEPRLSDSNAWYLHASNIDGLEYAYLEGQAGPQIESRNGFEVDGVQLKIRLDFGAGFVDHRAFFKNAGIS